MSLRRLVQLKQQSLARMFQFEFDKFHLAELKRESRLA
jgi:hypothetical protein